MTTRALLSIAIASLVVACAGNDASSSIQGTTTGAGMAIDYISVTAPPTSGANTFEVAVRKDGAPVEGATVTATFSMPAMPSMNMPEMHSDITLEPVGNGRYRGVGQLSMTGTWSVLVKVTRDGQELGTSSLSLVAK